MNRTSLRRVPERVDPACGAHRDRPRAIMTAANAYLGLKVGLTVSASIPAAVMSMLILRDCGSRTSPSSRTTRSKPWQVPGNRSVARDHLHRPILARSRNMDRGQRPIDLRDRVAWRHARNDVHHRTTTALHRRGGPTISRGRGLPRGPGRRRGGRRWSDRHRLCPHHRWVVRLGRQGDAYHQGTGSGSVPSVREDSSAPGSTQAWTSPRTAVRRLHRRATHRIVHLPRWRPRVRHPGAHLRHDQRMAGDGQRHRRASMRCGTSRSSASALVPWWLAASGHCGRCEPRSEGLRKALRPPVQGGAQDVRTEIDLPMPRVLIATGVLVGLTFIFYWTQWVPADGPCRGAVPRGHRLLLRRCRRRVHRWWSVRRIPRCRG